MGDLPLFESLLAFCLGLGLAASCGFRVFVPLLVISLAARTGLLTLAAGFEWMESWPAMGALGVATLLEIGGYYVPWLDNLLDTVSTPAAMIAGVIAAAASVTDMDPLLKWSVAVIAGGGSAGVVHVGTMGVRGLSTATTGGLANFLVATIEWVMALALSTLAIVMPVLAAILALLLVVWLGRYAIRLVGRMRLLRASGLSQPGDEGGQSN